jgi:molecular chaperone DnaK
MMRDAQEHADEDKRRREEAEARNLAEALQYQTEKFLGENGDKIPADSKTEINEALSDLRAALGGTDSARIKQAHEKLVEASQKAGAALYQQAQQAQASAGEGAGAASGGFGESTTGPSFTKTEATEDVVDAEIIDEDDKK